MNLPTFDRDVLQRIKICAHCGTPFGIGKKAKANFLKAKLCGLACMNAAKVYTLEKAVSVYWTRVNKTASCWLWTGAKTSAGYGDVVFQRKHILAHRFSWALQNGGIPKGLLALHKCDTPLCVRPDHLFLGTDADNMADAVAKGRANRITRAKLTEDQVREIRATYWFKNCRSNAHELAAKYSVVVGTICGVTSGRTWGHIK